MSLLDLDKYVEVKETLPVLKNRKTVAILFLFVVCATNLGKCAAEDSTPSKINLKYLLKLLSICALLAMKYI